MRKFLFLVSILILFTGCSKDDVSIRIKSEEPLVITASENFDIVLDMGVNFHGITAMGGKYNLYTHKDIMWMGKSFENPSLGIAYNENPRYLSEVVTHKEAMQGKDGFNDMLTVDLILDWDLEELPDYVVLPEGFKGHMLVGSIPEVHVVQEYRIIFYKEGVKGQFEVIFGDDTDTFMNDIHRIFSTIKIIDKGPYFHMSMNGMVNETK